MLSRCRAALRVASAALHRPVWSSGLPRTATGAALQRDPRFNVLTEAGTAARLPALLRCCFTEKMTHLPTTRKDVVFFRDILGASAVVTDKAELEAYNEDWLRKYTGASRIALKPKTTAQVSAVLAHCNERRLAVVPQGGNTGLVGGSVPVFDEVVLSTSSMSQIRSIDATAGVAVAQAGVVLEQLDNALAEHGLCVPLDLGAKGSCQLGGNVSTNAGGLRLLRYGSLHGSVLGLEVVLPDGRILDLLRTLRKDNTGYDIKQMFIGAEGTLGVITAVSLLAPARPASVQVAFLALPSFEAVLAITARARSELSEILSACEFMDRESLDLCLEKLDGTRDPLPLTRGGQYMVIETSGSNAEHDRAKLEAFLQSALESEQVLDGTVAADTTQARALWRLREGVTEALMKTGVVYKYDVSMPQASMYDLVTAMRARLPQTARTVGYGHVGDGNLHLNVTTPKHDPAVLALIEPFVYEWTRDVRGSVSAEHGIGQMKTGAIGYSKDEASLSIMRGLKNLMDPRGILNPYKVLPPPA